MNQETRDFITKCYENNGITIPNNPQELSSRGLSEAPYILHQIFEALDMYESSEEEE